MDIRLRAVEMMPPLLPGLQYIADTSKSNHISVRLDTQMDQDLR